MVDMACVSLILCVYGLVCFALGMLVMLPYKRMAVRQLEYIMASVDSAAYSSIYATTSHEEARKSGALMHDAQNELDRIYLAAMANGTVGDDEIERLGTTDNIVS